MLNSYFYLFYYSIFYLRVFLAWCVINKIKRYKMIGFKTFLLQEAYNYRPTSSDEIKDENLKELFILLKSLFPEESEPIAIDTKTKKAKVKKSLKSEVLNLPADTKNKILNNKAFYDFGNGSSNKNRRSMMSAIEDFGEIGVIEYLKKEFKTPEELGLDFYIDNPDVFQDWYNTFVASKKAIISLLKKPISNYYILHDARDTSDFDKVLKKFFKKSGMSKHNWNASDIFIIDKSNFTKIIKELNQIVNSLEGNQLIGIFNTKIYELYTEGLLYPISLKKVPNNKPSATVEYSNIPTETLTYADIKIDYFLCNFDLNTKEIGSIRFKNMDTDLPVTFQHNGQPPGYVTTQTEVTSDGSSTSGKIGKVPAFFVSNIMAEYNDYRIDSVKWFGSRKNKFGNFTKDKVKDTIDRYKYLTRKRYVKNNLSLSEFQDLISRREQLSDTEQDNLMMKIQGLRIQYFFAKNEKDISDIVNRMIFAAKKIGKENSFFIKVY